MADNYLEKKMEEHRRAVSVKPSMRRVTPVGNRAGTVTFRIDPLRVLVTDGSGDYSAAVIRRLREAGCKVAFVSADDKSGRELAQKSGARFYPLSFNRCVAEDLTQVWGGLDAVVVTDGIMPENVALDRLKRIITIGNNPQLASLRDNTGLTNNAIEMSDRSASDVADICLMLCLSASDTINNVVI